MWVFIYLINLLRRTQENIGRHALIKSFEGNIFEHLLYGGNFIKLFLA